MTELGRLGVAEHGADWVFSCPSEEFWWPRGESLKDVLAVVPPRYGVVQALVRNFVGSTDEKGFFAEERIARSSLLEHRESPAQPLSQVLRPVYRATPAIEIEPDDWTLGGRRVPLRAWYPIEVLRFPTPPVAGNDALVDDPRLRDASRSLRAGTDRVGGPYALPVDGVSRFDFPIPTSSTTPPTPIECAAVGEVDLVSLDRQIRELEARITGSRPSSGHVSAASSGVLPGAAASIVRNDRDRAEGAPAGAPEREAEPSQPTDKIDRVTVIKPAPRWPHLDVSRALALPRAARPARLARHHVRYKQTSIGVAWAMLQPFLTMVVFTLVFGKFANFPSEGVPYPIFSYSALLPWTYFASAVALSSASLVANRGLVTKVYFPRVLLPLAAVTVPIVDFCLGVRRARRR